MKPRKNCKHSELSSLSLTLAPLKAKTMENQTKKLHTTTNNFHVIIMFLCKEFLEEKLSFVNLLLVVKGNGSLIFGEEVAEDPHDQRGWYRQRIWTSLPWWMVYYKVHQFYDHHLLPNLYTYRKPSHDCILNIVSIHVCYWSCNICAWIVPYLESTSSRKELLGMLIESSAISTLILLITWSLYADKGGSILAFVL